MGSPGCTDRPCWVGEIHCPQGQSSATPRLGPSDHGRLWHMPAPLVGIFTRLTLEASFPVHPVLSSHAVRIHPVHSVLGPGVTARAGILARLFMNPQTWMSYLTLCLSLLVCEMKVTAAASMEGDNVQTCPDGAGQGPRAQLLPVGCDGAGCQQERWPWRSPFGKLPLLYLPGDTFERQWYRGHAQGCAEIAGEEGWCQVGK